MGSRCAFMVRHILEEFSVAKQGEPTGGGGEGIKKIGGEAVLIDVSLESPVVVEDHKEINWRRPVPIILFLQIDRTLHP